MSNFSYDDFAVLVRNFSNEMLKSDSLRIVPLFTAPSMAAAILGDVGQLGTDLESDAYIPAGADGLPIKSNVEVQHNSAGYCRLVGHIEPGNTEGLSNATAFALYRTVEDASEGTSKKEVIAVASLKEGFEIGEGCYPSFTITTVNNYQSVAFNPNAFATVEDLKNINGLDGLHIAFDTASGDLKLLDKDGNVLDQANLPIKADVIIAEGEEGYKYVKTDVAQDIHAAKAWMPAGATAWEDVAEAPYIMSHAALVVVPNASTPVSRVFVDSSNYKEYTIITEDFTSGHVVIEGGTYVVSPIDESGTRVNLIKVNGTGPVEITGCTKSDAQVSIPGGASYTISMDPLPVDCFNHENGVPYLVTESDSEPGTYLATSLVGSAGIDGGIEPTLSGTVKNSWDYSTGDVKGITLDGKNMYTFDEASENHSTITNISGNSAWWLDTKALTGVYILKYGLEAFVWTVKGADAVINEPFFQQLNASLLALGFHAGDDIALGTNIGALSENLDGVNADDYMHGELNSLQRAQEVDEQRRLAKEELVAWNAQHPALTHNEVAGTRISSDGVDIRNGKILIGDGSGLGGDAVKHYELSTNFKSGADSEDEGLALSVLDASGGALPRNVLTISDSSYISGAPICMALIEVTEPGGSLNFATKRRTACFECNMVEDGGTVNITITDKRLNSKGFATTFSARDDCIVEISPVYISGNSAPEMLPALNMVNTVATVGSTVENQNKNDKLTCTCPQIIDWANSVNISAAQDTGNHMFVIVKVY